ncbi:6-phosphogluconolactonase [Halovulum dunhuangense]|uniref:6-phosphogluconolactonase n=1 Tax=Halovulum dunhuangense TaxID=1505036 RepID=A0A849KX30_9RHOB|nr:6-phosphogluconolactonase [Halovulum dunhuangense]NNU78967.1 6-phosphogluconolactonase [Halovulum dunhuangense]
MIPAILHYASRQSLAADLAEMVARELSDALEAHGRATLAVPGGTTPGPFLEALSQADIDWARVRVMLTDERFVPESSDRSNTRLLRQTLLRGRAAEAVLVPFYAPGETPEDVIPDLSAAVQAVLPIDVCVLGMGEDMHTASIFPGADRLAEALAPLAPVLVPMRAPGAPEPRLTLSAPVLRAAGSLHLLIAGAGKKAALERALQDGPVEDAPVRAILSAPTPVTVHYAD